MQTNQSKQRQNPVRTEPHQAKQCRSVSKTKSAVGDPTRAESPLGARSTTWGTPFQSLTTSSPDLGSVELAKRPMLIDNKASRARRKKGAVEQTARAVAVAGERSASAGAGWAAAASSLLLLMRRRMVVVVVRRPWCRHWGRFGCYGQAARGGGQAAPQALSV
jgi:hypothetical protein